MSKSSSSRRLAGLEMGMDVDVKHIRRSRSTTTSASSEICQHALTAAFLVNFTISCTIMLVVMTKAYLSSSPGINPQVVRK